MGAATTITTVTKLKTQEGSEQRAPKPRAQKKMRETSKYKTVNCLVRVAAILNSNWLQTILYLVFVVLFQSLSQTMRMPQEYLVDKHVMDRLIENHFDSSHNTFNSVRRIPDIYEWGNNVLWPGLFADLGPCDPNGSPVGSVDAKKSCQDDVWPDGDGIFHLSGATPLGLAQLVERMDMFDWTEGLSFRQVRAPAGDCPTTSQLGTCYPEFAPGGGAREPFGYNHTHPSSPLAHPFKYFTAAQLGSNPRGMISAAIPSMATYETSGFVALVIPFFSDTFLKPEEGTATEVTDFRRHYVNTTNGRRAKFFCVRTSTNGLHLKQICDPGTNGDGTGALTGAVRAHVEVFWNDLKRAHWIDTRTRVVAIFGQLKSNYVGVRYRITLMFEQTALGAVLPSYDVETRILDKEAERDMGTFATIALILVVAFSLLEGVECAYYGAWSYFSDMWNLMDWSNFVIYYLVFAEVRRTQELIRVADCSSYLCKDVGYFDDWQLMGSFRTCKTYLSLCVCIQLFKCLKFASALVPKMGLATNVLRQCAVDLLFFGVTFVISMLAFSMMLYVQIGPQMEGYRDQFPAFISLFRALFGDFDIQEILDNSSGYLNTLLFLIYLFVAVFIMLSMFLAILAEAQVAVRATEDHMREDPDYREYGIISYGWDYLKGALTYSCKVVGVDITSKSSSSAYLPTRSPPVAASELVMVSEAIEENSSTPFNNAPAEHAPHAPAELPAPESIANGTAYNGRAGSQEGMGGVAALGDRSGGEKLSAETMYILEAIQSLHEEIHELRSKLPEAVWM